MRYPVFERNYYPVRWFVMACVFWLARRVHWLPPLSLALVKFGYRLESPVWDAWVEEEERAWLAGEDAAAEANEAWEAERRRFDADVWARLAPESD